MKLSHEQVKKRTEKILFELKSNPKASDSEIAAKIKKATGLGTTRTFVAKIRKSYNEVSARMANGTKTLEGTNHKNGIHKDGPIAAAAPAPKKPKAPRKAKKKPAPEVSRQAARPDSTAGQDFAGAARPSILVIEKLMHAYPEVERLVFLRRGGAVSVVATELVPKAYSIPL